MSPVKISRPGGSRSSPGSGLGGDIVKLIPPDGRMAGISRGTWKWLLEMKWAAITSHKKRN